MLPQCTLFIQCATSIASNIYLPYLTNERLLCTCKRIQQHESALYASNNCTATSNLLVLLSTWLLLAAINANLGNTTKSIDIFKIKIFKPSFNILEESTFSLDRKRLVISMYVMFDGNKISCTCKCQRFIHETDM